MTHTRRSSSLLVTLVFLTGCVRCVCAEKLSVWQTPRILTTAPGERVAITCHFTLRTMEAGRWNIQWRKRNDTEFKSDSVQETYPTIPTPLNRSVTLRFLHVTERNSGVYYCTIWQDVPRLGPKTSAEGTELIVDSTLRKNFSVTNTINTHQTAGWTSLLITLPLIVCVASIIYCCTHRGRCVRRKKENQLEQTSDSGVIYAAVKHKKLHKKKNTPEVCDVPDAGSDVPSDVLYSEIRIKS